MKLDGQKLGIALGAVLFFGGLALMENGSENLGLALIVGLFVMWPILKLFKVKEDR